jgi:hypothetical protein
MAAKDTVPPIPPRALRRELENLYARRGVIDDMIELLEQYKRYRAKPVPERELRTA